jgi:hypothetical protein
MTILYLHGLESKLSDVKRAVLEQFGAVIAPDLDYINNPEIFSFMMKACQNESVACIIGSSMGGFMGYYVAMKLDVPALLFNPALPIRSLNQEFPTDLCFKKQQRLSIVLGSQDETVPAVANLKFFSENLHPTVHYGIKIRPDLAHQIPLEVFEEECMFFLRSL